MQKYCRIFNLYICKLYSYIEYLIYITVYFYIIYLYIKGTNSSQTDK